MVGFRKPRKVRPKEKDLPKGYDSKWEHTLHETVLQDWEHHWELIPYIVKHKYEPDFVKKINGTTILLEAKGRFWDYPEYSTKRTHAEWAETNNFRWYSEDTLPLEWGNYGL